MWTPRRWIARWLAERRRECRRQLVQVLADAQRYDPPGERSDRALAAALGTSRYELGVCLRQLERAGAVSSRLQDLPGTERVYRLAEPDPEPETGPTPAWERPTDR